MKFDSIFSISIRFLLQFDLEIQFDTVSIFADFDIARNLIPYFDSATYECACECMIVICVLCVCHTLVGQCYELMNLCASCMLVLERIRSPQDSSHLLYRNMTS